MALMGDDGYARAIFPSHTMGDGDTRVLAGHGPVGRTSGRLAHRRAGRRRDGQGAGPGGDAGDRPAEHPGGAGSEEVNLHLAVLSAYSAGLMALGLWIGRRVHSSSDFLVAGRQLGPGLIFSTMLAANIGAGSTVSATAQGYLQGVAAWWWVGSAAIGSTALAFWIGPAMRRVAADARPAQRRRLSRVPLQRGGARHHLAAAVDRIDLHPRVATDRPRLDPERRRRRADADRLRRRRRGDHGLLHGGRAADVRARQRRPARGQDRRLCGRRAAGARRRRRLERGQPGAGRRRGVLDVLAGGRRLRLLLRVRAGVRGLAGPAAESARRARRSRRPPRRRLECARPVSLRGRPGRCSASPAAACSRRSPTASRRCRSC